VSVRFEIEETARDAVQTFYKHQLLVAEGPTTEAEWVKVGVLWDDFWDNMEELGDLTGVERLEL
jgi:hypothetical protein